MVDVKKVAARHIAASGYKSLKDAVVSTGDSRYGSGDSKIWYFKPSERILMKGNSYIRTHHPNRLPDFRDLSKTHILLGSVSEEDFKEILTMMQARLWSPRGEGESLITSLGLDHTSMTAGDVIQQRNKIYMVDSLGWFENLKMMTLQEAYSKGFRLLRKKGWEPKAHIELLTFDGKMADWVKFYEKFQMEARQDPFMRPLTPPFDFGYPEWEPWYEDVEDY